MLPASSSRRRSSAVTAAAAGAAAKLPPNTDFRVSIVNAPGAEAYPISSFTWLLVYETQTDAAKGKKLVDFMRWALNEWRERGRSRSTTRRFPEHDIDARQALDAGEARHGGHGEVAAVTRPLQNVPDRVTEPHEAPVCPKTYRSLS